MHRAEVLTHFAEHEWVASLTELDGLKVSKFALARARKAGVVTMVCPSVVAVASVELSFNGRARAAQLAAGPTSFISGTTAGRIHGLRSMPEGAIEVSMHEDHLRVVPTFATLVRTSWFDEERDVEEKHGVRVATPLRTLFGLAGTFNDHRFWRAAEDVWHLGLVTPEQAQTYLAAVRRSGRTGVARMERWLNKVAGRTRPTQSGLERTVVAAIERIGLPTPELQHPLRLRTGETIHIDIAWPAIRLGIEPGHSWWHGGDLGQRRDQGRDQACGEVGWAVHRFDEEQVAAPDLGRRLRRIHDERSALFRRTS